MPDQEVYDRRRPFRACRDYRGEHCERRALVAGTRPVHEIEDRVNRVVTYHPRQLIPAHFRTFVHEGKFVDFVLNAIKIVADASDQKIRRLLVELYPRFRSLLRYPFMRSALLSR